MKTQFWMSKGFLLIFASVLLTLSMQGISYSAPGGVCEVGDVLSPGESCTLPGTDVKFSVLPNGSARFGLFIFEGGTLDARNIILNGVSHNFVASKLADGNWRIDIAEDQTPPPSLTDPSGPEVLVVDPDAPPIYWSDYGTDKIQRVNFHGSNIEDLVTRGLRTPSGIALDVSAGKMYWTDYGMDKIQRANLDGSNIEALVTRGLRDPIGIALDVVGGKMYWTDAETDKIQRSNLDGSNIEDLITRGLELPVHIALDVVGGKMYWTDAETDKIQRSNLDGSNIEDLVTRGLNGPWGIALDVSGGKMYWADWITGKIQRANLDGSNVENLITRGLDSPSGIALDIAGGKMYWTHTASNSAPEAFTKGKIQRANLDGSDVEDLITGLGKPDGIALGTPTQTPSSTPDLVKDTAVQVGPEPIRTSDSVNYTFETINVPGVDFLSLTASSDFEDYAGYTQSEDGQKEVAFTLIDGMFKTYDVPGSQNTYFFALGNDGTAAGYYEDSEGRHSGIILQDGALQAYNFPNAVETEIYGISDATGALTGNFIDAAGMRRGFSGNIIVEFPGAVETYADFVNASGAIVGCYVDVDGTYHPYVRNPNGKFTSVRIPAEFLEYLFIHGLNDAWTYIVRNKVLGDVPRTYVGELLQGLEDFQFSSDQDLSLEQAISTLRELHFPGSVSTEGYNINQDGSVVGHYTSADGRRHGFIARPADPAESAHFGNVYTVTLSQGLNTLSVPLAPPKPMTAKNLVAMTGATTLITLDTASQRFVAWTPDAPDDGFPIEGAKGYIVNVPEARNFAFVGAPWTDPTEAAAAPSAITPLIVPSAITPLIRGDRGVTQEAWAFVVSGHLEGNPAFDGYQVSVRNLRTDSLITASVQYNYFAAATADLTRRSVVQVGDVIELRVIGPGGNVESQTLSVKVTPEHLSNAVLSVRLDDIGSPTQNLLLQNYPNPFNPETWIPYQLSEDSPVSVSIYGTTGRLIRTLSLGFQSAGFYNSRGRAAYWDGRNAVGEPVASGVYFYTLTAGDFSATRKMLIRK